MACPLCGEQCRCSYVAPKGADDDVSLAHSRTSVLIDPDSYEPTEEIFAASIDCSEPDDGPGGDIIGSASAPVAPFARAEAGPSAPAAPPPENTTLSGIERVAHEPVTEPERPHVPRRRRVEDETFVYYRADEWRDEVLSRVSSYRARRRRTPEGAMPLDFGQQEPAPRRNAAVERVASRYANRRALMEDPEPETEQADPAAESNIIEFPKPLEPPTRMLPFQRTQPLPLSNELADAAPEAPRILEAPESEEVEPVMPPVSAIMLDGEDDADDASAATLELPLRPAAVGERTFAGLVDLSAVVLASSTFALIFVKITGGIPHAKLAPAIGLLVVGALWSIYQFIFLVYGGTTPGLQVAGLAVRDFHGRRLARRERRNRALGIVVAAAPLGLGLLWALLDQEMLCWHDRISHSYVVQGR